MNVTKWSRLEHDQVEEGSRSDERGQRDHEGDDPRGIAHWYEDIAGGSAPVPEGQRETNWGLDLETSATLKV